MDRVMAPDELKIQLTETEEKICVLLDKCKEYLLAEKGISTTCRIAGGWVRDKLLGSQSNDLDIALSDIMGLAFAQHLAEFAKSQNIEVGTISKIAQNPDQSKHLETATFKMFGLEIDLVNLRSEEYASNSRIPTEVTFGTPVQDALRRDMTINALFYNVHTRTVEDFTGKGLNDLRNGIIRTPLPPRETFLDDPLRIIRCIRFASRFGFQFVPELENAEALVSKVARERAGMELTKMMKGRDPVHAISLIQDLSLFDPIFSVIPTDVVSTFSHPRSANIDSLKATSILRLLLSDTYTDRLYLAATLTPYLGVTYKDKKHREFPAITYVIRESLKLGTQNHYLDGIPALFAASEILKNPDLNQEKFRQSSERVIIGLMLREKAVHNANTGSHWTSSLLFSLLQELIPCCETIEEGLKVSAASEKITIYNRFVERVEELALTSAVDAKPLVDGREIVSLLNVKAGPWTGTALARVVEWQLEHPEGSKGECLMWLKEQLSAGTLGIDQNGPVSKKARIYK
ncbi:trna nucleotidyltransferase [Lentinula edodes]|uniref:Trna nucleotidyltransferase n=1 Tax=Lentinula edodes TaxID=5353 RepID=A0A1Q3EMB4_LENED|nr:trna nucleotidyltransferase [Lentinula edodes]